MQIKYRIQLFPASCCTKGKAARLAQGEQHQSRRSCDKESGVAGGEGLGSKVIKPRQVSINMTIASQGSAACTPCTGQPGSTQGPQAWAGLRAQPSSASPAQGVSQGTNIRAKSYKIKQFHCGLCRESLTDVLSLPFIQGSGAVALGAAVSPCPPAAHGTATNASSLPAPLCCQTAPE